MLLFSLLSLSAAYAALIAQSYPWKSRLLTIISIFDASLTPAPVYVNNSLSHCRQTSTHGQSMSLRIRRVSRNYILHNRSTTSAWFARTASCLRFPHKGVAKSRLQGHAPPAGNTPTMATLSRPFVKLSGLKAALYAHGVFIKVVFILRDIFCCLFRLIFSTLPLFSLQTTKILLTIFFAFFFGIVLPVLSWQTVSLFFWVWLANVF